nr:hypothetical protein [Tanacetum cinerariifolium]
MKQVTVAKPSNKSDSTTHPHVVTVKSQKTNIPVPPSTGVNSCPNASGSQPKSHVKSNRISPAKGVNKLPVEDQPRINKSHLRTSNRVDFSSRLKRTSSEGQAGSNPDETSEGQAGPDPGDAEAKVQSIPNSEHMDLDVADVSPQPSTKQLDEGFTATAYPKDFSFGDQFFSDNPSDADKNAETEVESMVSIDVSEVVTTTNTTTTTFLPPQAPQQSTTDAMMVKRIGELEHIMADLIQVNKDMEERLDSHGSRLDLPEADMKEILHQHKWESESYKSHEDHMQLFEALEKSMNRDHSEELAQDLAEARKKKKKSRESPKTPPGSPSHQPPPPPPPAESLSKGSAAPSPSKTIASAEYQAWTTTDISLRPSISLTPTNLEMDEDMAPDEQAQSSDDEDIGNAHILTVNLRQGWWKPSEEERPATPKPAWSICSSDVPTGDIAAFMDWFCKRRGITKLKPQDLEGPAYEIIKVFHPDVIHLQYQMEECHKLLTDSVDDPIPILSHNVSKPLPLGGPHGQVTIQSDFFFNKDFEYLRYGSKGRRPTLSISKMKAAYYLDAGPEQMMSGQFWIEEECKYDIAAMYGISHWWFQRQRFYID